MRKYEQIWIQLKQNNICKVAAHPLLHKRIKKAVTKEKYNDNAFKVLFDATEDAQPVLNVDVDSENPNVLIFTLVKPISLRDL